MTWDWPIRWPCSVLGVRIWEQRSRDAGESFREWAVATSLFWGTARSSVWCPVLMSVGERRVIWCSVGACGFSRGWLYGFGSHPATERFPAPPLSLRLTQDPVRSFFVCALNSARIIFCGLQLRRLTTNRGREGCRGGLGTNPSH